LLRIIVCWLVLLGLIEADFLLVFGCSGFVGWMGGFGGAVPVVCVVLAEQVQGVGGLGEDADGFGAADLDWVGVALLG
jgi:hypothetical protein